MMWPMRYLDNISNSIHSYVSSPTDEIKRAKFPINSLKNQHFPNRLETTTIFPGYVKHKIQYRNI